MKKNCLLLLLLVFSSVSAQVGIGTQLPLKPFHIDGKKDNLVSGVLTPEQEANDVVVDEEGRMGIGTISPTAKLDVRGDMTVEKRIKLIDVKDLDVNGIFPLYVDNEGKIGRIKPRDPKPFISLASIDSRPTDVTKFNKGDKIIIPFKVGDEGLKYGNIGSVTGNYFKINDAGSYSISGSMSLKMYLDSTAFFNVFLSSEIEYSRDGGSSWSPIVSIRPIQRVDYNRPTYQFVFPTVVVTLPQNTLVRITYTKSKISGQVEGSNKVTTIITDNDAALNLKVYEMSIIKL